MPPLREKFKEVESSGRFNMVLTISVGVFQ